MDNLKSVKKYEKRTKRTYLSFQDSKKDSWGGIVYKKREANMFTDSKLIFDSYTEFLLKKLKNKYIRITDFGGGDGVLLNTISHQLGSDYNLDLTNIDLTKKSIDICLKKYPKIRVINQDFLKTNILNQDVALSRFIIHYLNKKKTKSYFKKVFLSLRSGGFFILQNVESIFNNKAFEKFFAEVREAIAGEKSANMNNMNFMPDSNSAKSLLKEAGFSVYSQIFSTPVLYSVRNWQSRFDLSQKQILKLENIYNHYYKKNPEIFIKKDNRLYANAQLFVVYAKK